MAKVNKLPELRTVGRFSGCLYWAYWVKKIAQKKIVAVLINWLRKWCHTDSDTALVVYVSFREGLSLA